MLSIFSLGASAAAYKTLTFPEGNSESITAYNKTWTATIDGFTWTLVNFNNNANKWAYVKCGPKTGGTGTITSAAIDKKIGMVVVTIDKIIATYAESAKLEVSTDANFSTISETVDFGTITAGEKQLSISTPVANAYYRLSFVATSGSSSHGVFQISKVEYYQEGTGPEEEVYPEVANIAALKELESGSKAVLTFNNVQVNFTSGKDMYIQDATGGIDIYDCGLSYTAGQVLNGKATVEYKLYNEMPEITSVTNAEITATDGEVTPNTVSVEGVTKAKICQLVKVVGTVHIEKETVTPSEGDPYERNNYFLVDEDDNSVLFYQKWKDVEGTDLSGLTEGAQATITGIVVIQNGSAAIGVTKAEYEGTIPEGPKAENIAAFKALENNTEAELTLTDAVVTFVNVKDMYITDATGSIDFYNTGLSYTAGQKLNGTIKVKFSVYRNTPQATNPSENNLTATDGEATPQEVAISDVSLAKVCDYVKVSGKVKILEETSGDKTYTNYYITDESDNKVMIFNKFKGVPGTDITILNDGDEATITGIIVPFNDTVEIAVTAMESTSTGIDNINAELTNDAPIYNLAGQRVEKAVKGINIQNGKKFIVK
jgi:hypothetical protein